MLFPSVTANSIDLYTNYERISSNAEKKVLLNLPLIRVWGFIVYTVN